MSCEKLKKMQTELKALIDNKDSTSAQYEKFYKDNNIPYKNILQEELKKSCSTIIAQGSENRIEIHPDCPKIAEDLCMVIHNVSREVVDGDPRLLPWYYRDCYDKYGPYAINNIQTNISAIKSECIVNTYLNDPELNNNKETAIVVAMILADQEIKCKPGEKNDFTYQFGTTEKILSINRCLNTALSEQKNYMRGCRFSNRRQENISDLINNCMIESTFGKPVSEKPPNKIPPNKIPPNDQPDNLPIFNDTLSSYTTTPNINNLNTTTPNTTTLKPTDNSLNIIAVVAIIFAAILIGYFFF